MKLSTYQQYLQSFNGRDYESVLEFWAPNFTCTMGDKILFGSPAELKKFYSFLHAYIDEFIQIDRFLSDENNLFMEARVRITAKRTMTREIIDDSGFHTLTPIEEGTVLDLPQIIHYHLENGKFILANCLMAGPPTMLCP